MIELRLEPEDANQLLLAITCRRDYISSIMSDVASKHDNMEQVVALSSSYKSLGTTMVLLLTSGATLP
jgi:hypothetical protein